MGDIDPPKQREYQRMKSPNKFLIEGIKKNQIEEVFNNQDLV